MSDLRMGIYRHYKGPLYQVIGLAHDANADELTVAHKCDAGSYFGSLGERTVVVYMPLQLDGAHFGPRMAVRTLEDFEGWVEVDNEQLAQVEALNKGRWQGHQVGIGATDDSVVVRRFTYLGPVFGQDML